MPHDSSRRDFLRTAAYVPPVLLSFHAVPSFARPGSVSDVTQGSGNRTGNSDIAPSPDFNASSRSGSAGARVSGLDLPEYGNVASAPSSNSCEPGEDRAFGINDSGQVFAGDRPGKAPMPMPQVDVGSCDNGGKSRSRQGMMRGLFSKLWRQEA